MVGAGALATAGLGALFKLGASIKQARGAKKAGREAKKMEQQGWNKYYTPEAFKEKEAMVRNQYNDPKMMGQRVLEDKLGASTSNSIQNIRRTAGSGAEAMLGLGLAQNNLNKGMQDIGLNAMAQRYNDFNALINTLRQKESYQDREWEINKWTPYQNKLAEKQALEHSSRANLQNFGKDIGSLGMTAFAMKQGGMLGSNTEESNVSVPTPQSIGFNLSKIMGSPNDSYIPSNNIQDIVPEEQMYRAGYPNETPYWTYANFLKSRPSRGFSNVLTPRF